MEHTNIDFTAIVNPASGPGTPLYPSKLYAEAITKLNAYSNVRTVGYVDTRRGQRNTKTVVEEVKTYTTWSQNPGLALRRVFFDQTPLFGSNGKRAYLKNITAPVKHSHSFTGTDLAIYNTGSIPRRALDTSYVDSTIVLEGAYTDVPTQKDLKQQLSAMPGRREN